MAERSDRSDNRDRGGRQRRRSRSNARAASTKENSEPSSGHAEDKRSERTDHGEHRDGGRDRGRDGGSRDRGRDGGSRDRGRDGGRDGDGERRPRRRSKSANARPSGTKESNERGDQTESKRSERGGDHRSERSGGDHGSSERGDQSESRRSERGGDHGDGRGGGRRERRRSRSNARGPKENSERRGSDRGGSERGGSERGGSKDRHHHSKDRRHEGDDDDHHHQRHHHSKDKHRNDSESGSSRRDRGSERERKSGDGGSLNKSLNFLNASSGHIPSGNIRASAYSTTPVTACDRNNTDGNRRDGNRRGSSDEHHFAASFDDVPEFQEEKQPNVHNERSSSKLGEMADYDLSAAADSDDNLSPAESNKKQLHASSHGGRGPRGGGGAASPRKRNNSEGLHGSVRQQQQRPGGSLRGSSEHHHRSNSHNTNDRVSSLGESAHNRRSGHENSPRGRVQAQQRGPPRRRRSRSRNSGQVGKNRFASRYANLATTQPGNTIDLTTLNDLTGAEVDLDIEGGSDSEEEFLENKEEYRGPVEADDPDAAAVLESEDGLQKNIVRDQFNVNIYERYEFIEQLESTADVTLEKVKKKSGGSAFVENNLFKKILFAAPTLDSKERRKVDMYYCLKKIRCDVLDSHCISELKHEINVLKAIDYPNIVKAFEVYHQKNMIYVVMECCHGGSLLDKFPYSEKETARISRELLSAVKYLHEHGIVHRGLKLENILFESDARDSVIKLTDFGLSSKLKADEKDIMTAEIETIYTMSPQQLQGVFTSQADLWSCGVIIYTMLGARKPFYHKRRQKMIDLIMYGTYDPMHKSTDEVWNGVSDAAKDLVKNLLIVDPKRRLNATGAVNHKWFKDFENLSMEPISAEVFNEVSKSLIEYKNTSELKKIALNVIAHRSNDTEIKALRTVFDTYDVERNGTIDLEELQDALKSTISADVVAEMFANLDVNKNGVIMYTEFLAATIEAQGKIEEERIAEAFDRLDEDDSGYITRTNLRRLLNAPSDYDDRVNAIMTEADTNRDGKISYGEFLKAFRSNRRVSITELYSNANAVDDSESTEVDKHDDLADNKAKKKGSRFSVGLGGLKVRNKNEWEV